MPPEATEAITTGGSELGASGATESGGVGALERGLPTGATDHWDY